MLSLAWPGEDNKPWGARRFTVEYYIIRNYERINKSATVRAKDWNAAAKMVDTGGYYPYVTSITEHRY